MTDVSPSPDAARNPPDAAPAQAPRTARAANAEPLERSIQPFAPSRSMPTDFTISLAEKGGTDRQLLEPSTERRQAMRGFDPTYVDIVDFIVRVTHRIWEEKDVGYIYDTYRHNARVIDDQGLQYGRDKIIADTLHTLNAFPDIRLFADEIIWAGDDARGFHTSHRAVMVGHNTGPSRFGSPTGRRIMVWCLANCVALENEIFEEWVLYNTASLITQLGLNLRNTAQAFGDAIETVQDLLDPRFGEAERLLGQGKPRRLSPRPPIDEDLAGYLRHAQHEIWNWRNVAAVDDVYSPELCIHGPSGREYYGRGEYKSFVISLLAMFPDLAMHVDDVYFMGNPGDGYLSSVRWSAVGTHRGHGAYGPPTGRRVQLWGILQQRIADGRITEEWMLFNEFQVLQQLLRRQALPAS